jgi:hypothetical protein
MATTSNAYDHGEILDSASEIRTPDSGLKYIDLEE